MSAIFVWLAVFALAFGLLVVSVTASYVSVGHAPLINLGAAGLTLLAALAVVALLMIKQQLNRQQSQVSQVLRSLKNRDSSLSIPGAPQIQPLLQQIQQEIARSRDDAEVQASYLKALIAQLDIAVLEFDADGYVMQSNPAAERLLGARFLQAWRVAVNRSDTGEHEPSLRKNIKALQQLIQHNTSGRRGELIWHFPNRKETLLYTLIHGFNQGQQRTLVTLQSIEKQLVYHEVKAHQQLVKVLTHEVANSITPMVSLTQSAQHINAHMLENGVQGSDDLAEALATITRRGQHLTQFIQSFKALSEPVRAQLSVQPLARQINEVVRLLTVELEGITLVVDVDNDVAVSIDPGLFEQVLINLLKNAAEATMGQDQRRVQLKARRIDDQVCLDIIDNGSGISEHAAASIFVPFFTTKTTGTGIGLPLARSLMLSQGGNLLLLDATDHGHFRCVFG
ncbi:sensor histidine kinase [Aliidiomarina maris]|uniref:histidine kinase n=1 Tax=Aliidiomarina maris TaxID=531312 RepID=A0A327X6V7_9GAMM|nr:ATP-binding protein [Aliidiomarina maris]RAK01392.1 histidine kinase/DNA gyrase B/HSP90-like ATPase [Aliidiomarina maris]RUO28240.1 hypothetical protein CWE07_00065 [Aliidiomarina maris]